MRAKHSLKIELQRFTEIVSYYALGGEADLFLTGQGFAGDTISYICLRPITEMILTTRITKEDVALYTFSNSLPTFGFISYNFGEILKGIRTTPVPDFPMGYLKKYDAIIKYDHSDNTLEITSSYDAGVSRLKDEINSIESKSPAALPIIENVNVEASLSREEYVAGVEKVLELIRNGDIYQLNLTIKYQARLENIEPASIFVDFFNTHPAPYYCYYTCGDYHLISTSPELFLRVRQGEVVSQPIKGTLAFDKYKASLISKLTDSPKESAELSMIVDMVRNDIGYNCEPGSVEVKDHKSTFVVDRLLQMYSSVTGRLKGERTVIDLLWDAFPGASVTGCPKIAAMKHIAQLEPHRRNAYCGSFLVIHDEKSIDSSIAIRTADYNADSGELAFYAGSGIVIDSVPEKEYQETTAKAKKFLDYLNSL